MSLVSAVLAAVFLAASLILEAAVPGCALGRWLAAAGLAFLVLAVLAPYRPDSPSLRRRIVSLYRHVPHPHLKHRAERGAPTVAGAVEKASLNMRLAAWGTRKFGSMPAFYLFVIYGALGAVFVKYQATLLYWSNWIQLWSLPLLMVGGIVLGMAHDKMAQQQFDDTEALLHEQGQTAAHLAAQDEKILAILEQIQANTALTEQVKIAVTQAPPPARV